MNNILWLGPKRPRLHTFMTSVGEKVYYYEGPLEADSPLILDTDFIVSYGYRYIIKNDILSKFYQRAINLHISYLPWNRGADPNFWSIVEDTPKGVTIHYIDEGLDTGDIIVQKEVGLELTDTLHSSYERLCEELEQLFLSNWNGIKNQKLKAIPQNQEHGSFHYKKDKEAFKNLLHKGWDTPISDIQGKNRYSL